MCALIHSAGERGDIDHAAWERRKQSQQVPLIGLETYSELLLLRYSSNIYQNQVEIKFILINVR